MEVTLALGSLIVGLISAGVSIWQHFDNKSMAEEQYEKNFEFNKETRDMTWGREDNQIQRAKEDAIAAGFSPLAALGNTASGGGTVSAPAPTAQQTPIDISGLVNALSTMYTAETQAKTAKETTESNNETAEEIAKIQAGESKANRESAAETADKDRKESARQFNEMLMNTKKQQKIENKHKDRELTTAEGILTEQTRANTENEQIQWSKMYQEWYKENKLENAPMGKICETWEEYNSELNTWYSKAKIMLDELGFDTTAIGETTEQNGITTGIKSILGLGTDAKIGKNTKQSLSRSDATYAERKWNAWLRSHPQPVPPMPTKEKKAS